MVITGITIVSNSLPIDGVDYAVARITQASDIPEIFTSLIYPEGKVRATSGLKNSPFENLPAVYTFVKNVHIIPTEDGNNSVEAELIPNLDELFAPFEFVDDLKAECIEFFFKQRASQLNLSTDIVELTDENGTKTSGFLFHSIDEAAYISSTAMTPQELFNANKAAELMSGKPVEMLFADFMQKCVDIYNSENYHKKAVVIADIIASTYKIDAGVETSLNVVEVEKFLEDIKNDIYVRNEFVHPGEGTAPEASEDGKYTMETSKEIITGIIRNILYFDKIGNRGPLNITGVNNLISNVKDNIKIC